jgi:hypothetical protein
MSLKPQPFDLEFADDIRAECVAFLGRITDYRATLVLTKGKTHRDPAERWSYGAYGPQNLQALGPEYERRGVPLLYFVSKLMVAIPQDHLLKELEGKTLGRSADGSLELQDRQRDI